MSLNALSSRSAFPDRPALYPGAFPYQGLGSLGKGAEPKSPSPCVTQGTATKQRFIRYLSIAVRTSLRDRLCLTTGRTESTLCNHQDGLGKLNVHVSASPVKATDGAPKWSHFYHRAKLAEHTAEE